MNINVTIGLNDDTKIALSALTAAICGMASQTFEAPAAAEVSKTAEKTEAKAATKSTKAADKPVVEKEEEAPVTIYWFSSASGETGVVESEDEYKALKKADAKTVKITEAKHKALLAKQAEEAEESTDDTDDTAEAPTVQDIIDVFGKYLPTTLSDKEKAQRRPFVKAILDRFDAKRASELAEEHRALAINFVERKMAGEDVDPAEAEYEELDGLV